MTKNILVFFLSQLIRPNNLYMQEMLFRVAGLPMVENCMSGYNSCMFAYGQVLLNVSYIPSAYLRIPFYRVWQ